MYYILQKVLNFVEHDTTIYTLSLGSCSRNPMRGYQSFSRTWRRRVVRLEVESYGDEELEVCCLPQDQQDCPEPGALVQGVDDPFECDAGYPRSPIPGGQSASQSPRARVPGGELGREGSRQCAERIGVCEVMSCTGQRASSARSQSTFERREKRSRTKAFGGVRLRCAFLWTLVSQFWWAGADPALRLKGGPLVAHASHNETTLFSPEWEANWESRGVGCNMGRKRYVWRPCGFGSNVIHLLYAWVYGLAARKWSDVAVISKKGQLEALQCSGDDGRPLSGYECLFAPMPHVCTFNSVQGWKQYMKRHDVPMRVRREAASLDWQHLRKTQRDVIADAVEQYGLDAFGAMAVMARYMWSNLAPWLERDVLEKVHQPGLEVFRQSPFVGLHIRRGDKIAEGEMKKVETEEYLAAAVTYLDNEGESFRRRANDMEAIWVASDDKNAVKEVRALAPRYFPNVSPDAIMWMSGGDSGGTVTTRSELESYQGFVLIFADLQLLATADVFVGTYSSNISRLVALLREAIGRKARESSLSLDRPEFGVNY